MFTQPSDSLVTCPFDKSHQVLRSRIHYHLIKCSKKHPTSNKVICPYDATEYLDPEEMPNHLFNCKSKLAIDNRMYAEDKMSRNKDHGNVLKTAFHYPDLEVPDEDWAGESLVQSEFTLYKMVKPWNSLLTSQPKNLSSTGRGKLLKDYLESVNNRCDGSYCTKSCCPKSANYKSEGRGAVLKKYLNQVMDSKPIGRGERLKIISQSISNSETIAPRKVNGHVGSSKQTSDCEDGKYDDL